MKKLPKVIYVKLTEDSDGSTYLSAERNAFAIADNSGVQETVGVYELKTTKKVKKLVSVLTLPLCVLCASAVSPLGATTVAGTIKAPSGTGITGTVQLELSAPGITGAELLLIQPRVQCPVTGGIVGTCSVRGNDTISSPAGTYYCVRVLSPSGAPLTVKGLPYTITGASFNLGTAAQAAGKSCR